MKNLLILGANSDIAKAVALRYAKEGYDLTLASRNPELSKDLIDQLTSFGIQIENTYFDALDFNSHTSFLSQLKMKPDKALVAFGYLGDNQLADRDEKEAQLIRDTNFTGAKSICDELVKHHTKILAISSVAGERVKESNRHYSEAKFHFTQYLNELLQQGKKVLVIKPGFVKTKMIDHLQTNDLLTASPELVAEAIYNSDKSGKKELYVKPIWRLIMFIIRNIPGFIFKKLNL